ncbi:hypothetical protein EI94DRAFT_1716349 [Lactarius quietus]|nr:hypothetical protein EI94DRAFT_1716349 [Lactarius quietus]
MNPFFMIYAFAACNVHLPQNFNRQLFWKHLDALVHIQRCPGLQSILSSGSTTGTRRDPEDIVSTLLTLRNTGRLPLPMQPPTHELLLVIDGTNWTASTSSLGRFSYTADDLATEDVAPFALLDALTRWLPRWRDSAILVRTNDVCVMWGVRGYARSGAWRAVRRVCAQYDVTLQRTELIDHRLEDNVRSGGNSSVSHAAPVRHLRDPDAVKTAVKGLAAPGQESDPAHRVMMRHLML